MIFGIEVHHIPHRSPGTGIVAAVPRSVNLHLGVGGRAGQKCNGSHDEQVGHHATHRTPPYDLGFQGAGAKLWMDSFMRVTERVNTANPACAKVAEKTAGASRPALANC